MSFVPADAAAGKCSGCGKTAYPNERINACSQFWHKTCLKCQSCGLILNLKTVESFQNKPYCKVHKPNVSHTQVTDSVIQKTAAAAPKAHKTQGVRRDERMTFAPGQAQPIRGVSGPPARGPAPRGGPAGPAGPARAGPAPGAPKASPKPSFTPVSSSGPKIGGSGDKCPGCGKTVYPTEAVRACAASWHKTCLKCSDCGLVLNLKTVESFQNKPYCKVHKPNPKHTQVTDSVAAVNAKNAPKAVRAAGSVKRDQRMTIAPGVGLHAAAGGDLINPGGVADNNAQSRFAPTRAYEPPAPAGASTASYEQASYDEPASGGYGGYDEPASGGYGGYEEPASGGYEEPASSGGYEEPASGGYEDQGGYDQGGYDQGGYEDQGGYDQGGYDQGGYEEQGGYDQGGYDQGGYDQGGYEDQGGYDQGGYDDQGGYEQGGGDDDWS